MKQKKRIFMLFGGLVMALALVAIPLAGALADDVGNANFQELLAKFPNLYDPVTGVTQPVFNLLAANVIHEEVWIEVPVESFATGQLGIEHSSKGQRDLICIRITRPRPVDPNYPHTANPANPTGYVRVPVFMEHSPYRGNNLPTIEYNRAVGKNHANTEFSTNPVTIDNVLHSARPYGINPDTSHYTYADVKSSRLKLHEWPWSDAAYPDPYYSIPASRGAKPIAMANSFSSGATASGGLGLFNYMFTRGFAVITCSTPGNRHSLSTSSATAGPFNDGMNAYGEAYEMLASVATIKWLNGECRGYRTKDATQEVVAYWANGDVAMTGTSYNGTVQMATASSGYEKLRVIIPVAGLSSMYTYFRQNGAVYPGDQAQSEDAEWLSRYDLSRWSDPNFALGRPDRTAYENIMARHANEIERETGDYNQFWDMGNWYGQAGRYKAAVLFMQGLDDRNVGTQHMDQLYRALKAVDPNYPMKMIIHLGAHTTLWNWGSADALGTAHKWLDRYVYGIENGIDKNGIDVWVANNVTGECNTYSKWPATGSEMRRYYFGQNTEGGGQLYTTAPIKEVAGPFIDQLKYRVMDDFRNPADPFYNPTVANDTNSSGSTNWWYNKESLIQRAWETTMLFPSAVPASQGSSTINVKPDELLKHTNARLAYVSDVLTKPVTLSGTTRVTLDVVPDKGIGSLSVMIVDLGDARRGYQTSSTVAAWQIPGFTNGYNAYNRFEYTFSTAVTQYKIVCRDSVDVQNPNPSGITYIDANITKDMGFVPPYWYQTVKIEPGQPYSYTFTLEPRHYTFKEGNRLAVVVYSTDYRHTIRPYEATSFELKLGAGSYIDLPLMSPLPAPTAPSYNVYLQPDRAEADLGDTFLVDVMLEGSINYTQLATEIAYDDTLLEFAGYANLSGWAASVTKSAPGKVAVRSVPGMNMVIGAPCTDDVKIVTLKFTAKGKFTGESIDTALGFASVLVSPPGGVTGTRVAPSLPVTVTLINPVVGAMGGVNLITDKEIEIVFDAPVIARNAKASFDVLVGGKKVDFDFLSYFAFGDFAANPLVNIRLKQALQIRTAPYTQYTLGAQAAASISVVAKGTGQTSGAAWKPFYAYYDALSTSSSTPHAGQWGNRGSRGLMWVWGNSDSRVLASHVNSGAFNYIPATNRTTYTGQSAAGVPNAIANMTSCIDRTVGRSELFVQSAIDQGMHVVVVGNGQSIYTVPEFRHLYEHGVTTDTFTRVAIGGTRENPVVATTAEDTYRVKVPYDNTYEFMAEFARLFLELGVKDGWSRFPLGPYDGPDDYNALKRLQAAFANAKAKNLWPGTIMQNSLEDYYVYGVMTWYECMPESATWQEKAFPINTRNEMLGYDPMLYQVLAEIHGEWEYHVGSISGSTDSARRWSGPWYKHSQADNVTVVGGAIVPYEPLKVVETNLISPSQVELVFNREIHADDLDALRTLANWELEWTPAETISYNVGATVRTFNAGQTYKFNNTSTPRLEMEYYMWKTLTLKVTAHKFNTGIMSYDIGGFTQKEIDDGFNDQLTIEQGYKPWFSEDAYYRDLTPVGVGFMGDAGDISGWMADTASSRTFMAVSPKVLATQTAAQIASKRLVEAKKIPREAFVGKPGALMKNGYVKFEWDANDNTKGAYWDYDMKTGNKTGAQPRFPVAINGVLTAEFRGAATAVKDWAGNPLASRKYTAQIKPWQTQVYRSEKTGVYNYADKDTARTSLLVAGDYWDYMYSGVYDNMGQRMADGFNFAFHHQNVKTGEYGSGGLDIIGYHTHMYMPSNRRSLYSAGPTVLYAEGLGYLVCSSMEYALLRDYQYTRYMHESIMHHEGAHSVEFPGMFYFTDLNFEVHEIWNELRAEGLWRSAYPMNNSAEWFGTLSTQWFGTQRESVDGTFTGVWTPISTREEIYTYDRKSYEFMKKVYYSGETYLDPAKVPGGITKLPGWDAQGNSINNDIIKWGLTNPGTMNENRAEYGITNQFRWISWGGPNVWDITESLIPNTGIRYKEGVDNPFYAGRVLYGENHNPYLLEYKYKDSFALPLPELMIIQPEIIENLDQDPVIDELEDIEDNEGFGDDEGYEDDIK